MIAQSLAAYYFLLTTIAGSCAQNAGNLNCTFDRIGKCSWTNVWKAQGLDDFNWKLGSGSKGSQKGSGANSGYRRSKGYVYIKSKNWMNRTAMLMSPTFTRTYPTCLQFWYFMKGRTMGHLAVIRSKSCKTLQQHQTVIWNLRGHQGNQWKKGKVALPVTKGGVVAFEAFDWKRGKSGNILLDQVTLTKITENSPCTLTPSYAQPATQTTETTPLMTTATQTQPTSTEQTTAIAATSLGRQTSRTSTLPSNDTMVTPKLNFTIKSPTTLSGNVTVGTVTNAGTTAGPTTANSSFPTGGMLAANDTKTRIVGIVLGAVVAVCLATVVLVVYLRRRRKPRTMYADDCSVTMTRMYPNITSDPHVDYRKLT